MGPHIQEICVPTSSPLLLPPADFLKSLTKQKQFLPCQEPRNGATSIVSPFKEGHYKAREFGYNPAHSPTLKY